VISTAAVRPGRSSFLHRLIRSSESDLAAYWAGIVDDFHALTADVVAAPIAAAVILSHLVDALTTLLALSNNFPKAIQSAQPSSPPGACQGCSSRRR
jgi:hypothetical protein